MSMDYFSFSGASGGAKEEDAFSCLKADIEDIRSRCNSTAQQSARLEAGMADLRSMYVHTHNQVKGLKQILHASDDDADTDSNDSAHHPLLLSRGSPSRKSPLLPRVGSASQDSAGDDDPASVLQLQQDVNVIGFEVEKLVSKVDPLEDVVKLLDSDLRQLSAKYAKAVDDIEKLKASALVGDVVAAADDPRMKMKMDLDEKIKKLEAEISEIKEMRAQYSFTTMIRGSFRGMKDRFTHKVHHMQQQFRVNMDVLRLNCRRQYGRFCQQLDGLIHKLRLYDPFVQGTLFGSAMGLLFLYAYIKCSRPSSQIKQVQAESMAKEEGITKKLASSMLQASEDGLESMVKEVKEKMASSQLLEACKDKLEAKRREYGVANMLVSSKVQDCQDKLEPKPKEQGVVKKLVSSKPQDKLESKPKEEGMERKSRSDKEVAGEGKSGEKNQDEIVKFVVRFGVILLICLLI